MNTRLALAVACTLAWTPLARAASPVGEVNVDCTRVEGWGQDPDDPAATIDVHLYFDGPAGDPAATGIALTANLALAGGCVGDQCAHGFRSALPLSRLDGLPHPVHAYGIDTVDPNLELSLSPAIYTCPPLPIVAGVKRHIVGPAILDQWLFSIYFDMMKVGDVALAAVPESTVVDGPPQLVVAEGTTEPIWLIDHGFRRPVPPELVGPWRFVTASATPMPAADLMALPEGTVLSARPVLAQGSGPKVYLLDDYQCAPGDVNPACEQPVEPTTGGEDVTSGGDGTSDGGETQSGDTAGSSGALDTDSVPMGSSGSGGGTSGDSAAGDGESEGCGCRGSRSGGLWGVLLLVGWRRRKPSGGRTPALRARRGCAGRA